VKVPNRRRRTVYRRDTVDKRMLLDIMRDLEPGLTKPEASKAYDIVTRAINAWLQARTRVAPPGVHSRLLLSNCFSINICWLKGKPDAYPSWPAVWVGLPRYARDALRRQRYAEYYAWKARGRQ